MGTTTIEWTNKVWNPVTGCNKVSSGCKHCYAERLFPRIYASAGRNFSDVRCHYDRVEHPLRWRKPCRIFVNSMGDLFHEKVPFEFTAVIFGTMAVSRQHVFQILTKRPHRALEWFATAERSTPDQVL